MFTMPAIHHSSMRMDDGSIGAMHLNALNGSSDALGFRDMSGYSDQTGVFGGRFGSTFTDNHLYKHDTGVSFRDSAPASTYTSSLLSSFSSSNDPNSTHRRSENRHPIGQRRRSLDLNAMPSNIHPRYRHRDRSLSVGELVIGPVSRFGQCMDDAIDENDMTSGLSLDGLSLTDVSMRSSNSRGFDRQCHCHDSTSKTCQAGSKKKRGHSSDAGVSVKIFKLLEKIKDNTSSRHGRNRSEVCQEEQGAQMTSSKSGSSRQNKPRHQSDSEPQKQEQRGRCSSERKLTIRSNAD